MSDQKQTNLTENKTVDSRLTQTSKKPKRSRKKKFLLGVLVLLLVGGSVAAKISSMKTAAIPLLSTQTLETGTVEQNISATGTVTGSDSAEITSNLNFEFIQINVKEGDVVKKGDILGVLDSKVLQDDYNIALKELAISQAQLQEQRTSASLAVKEREMDYREAKRQNEIAKQLFSEGGISNDELVQSDMMLQKAGLALDTAKDALNRASGGSASLGIDIKRELISTKKDNLDKANITSPIDGTVTRVNAKIGRIPTAQDQARAMFIVENLSDLIMKVSISEYDIANIEVGQKVVISSDVLRGDKIEGEVARIAPTGEVVQGANSREMRVPVEIKITNKGKIIAGVNAKAEIIINKKENVLAAPIEAILEEEGEKYVLVGNDMKIKKVKVQTGIESVTNVELISDEIKAGDILITNPTAEHKDGSAYRTME
ncbi:MAG: HlyD family efflux transporter periplasmic adaptor subunit [Peptostreptococcaceae bacterium]|nr:HlyD family efflux transporter periplasmic adaptor subunit [Peptostreptococcaceae bacterium]